METKRKVFVFEVHGKKFVVLDQPTVKPFQVSQLPLLQIPVLGVQESFRLAAAGKESSLLRSSLCIANELCSLAPEDVCTPNGKNICPGKLRVQAINTVWRKIFFPLGVQQVPGVKGSGARGQPSTVGSDY